MIKVGHMNEAYDSVSNNLDWALDVFVKRTGVHNGGDCAIIAKFIADYLDELEEPYSFSGEIIDDGLSHVFVKYKGKYYDGVEGRMNTSGRQIVDNLKDDGRSIGNNKYGWIDYKLGSSNYKTTKSYKIWNEITDDIG